MSFSLFLSEESKIARSTGLEIFAVEPNVFKAMEFDEVYEYFHDSNNPNSVIQYFAGPDSMCS